MLAIDSEGVLENLLGGVSYKKDLLGSKLQVCLSIFQNPSITRNQVPSANVSAIDLLLFWSIRRLHLGFIHCELRCLPFSKGAECGVSSCPVADSGWFLGSMEPPFGLQLALTGTDDRL